MVIKGSSRGASESDAAKLATHLMDRRENQIATVLEMRGIAAQDIAGALSEMRAVTIGTRSRRALMHCSLSLPADEAFDLNDPRWIEAADTLERHLGLVGHQRVIVGHSKQGRRHTHVVWCRADPLSLRIASDSHNRDRQSDADPEKIVVPVARAYTVFHVSQMDGPDGKPLPPWVPPTLEEAPWQAPEAVEQIIDGAKATGLSFLEQGDKAFYSPSQDTVVTPPRAVFSDEARWSETILHEVGHASGAALPGRLNRQFGKRFGGRAYAFEELVAEATSAFGSSLENDAHAGAGTQRFLGIPSLTDG